MIYIGKVRPSIMEPPAVCLFLAFDFWEYERHVGGTSNDVYR